MGRDHGTNDQRVEEEGAAAGPRPPLGRDQSADERGGKDQDTFGAGQCRQRKRNAGPLIALLVAALLHQPQRNHDQRGEQRGLETGRAVEGVCAVRRDERGPGPGQQTSARRDRVNLMQPAGTQGPRRDDRSEPAADPDQFGKEQHVRVAEKEDHAGHEQHQQEVGVALDVLADIEVRPAAQREELAVAEGDEGVVVDLWPVRGRLPQVRAQDHHCDANRRPAFCPRFAHAFDTRLWRKCARCRRTGGRCRCFRMPPMGHRRHVRLNRRRIPAMPPT
jgi:hypothetical protein